MRKLTFAALVAFGAAFAMPATAAPLPPMGVTAPDAVTTVRMDRMERRMVRHRMERRMMRRHMRHRMMRRHMMRHM